MEGSSHGRWHWRPDYLGTHTVHAMGYVFLGWVIGWTTATIARVIYPAPRWTLVNQECRDQASGG